MLITVINYSDGCVDDDELLRAIRAVNRQLDHDFRPYWNLTGELRLGGRRGTPLPENYPDTRGDAIIYIKDASMKSEEIGDGINGYHEKRADGVPVAHIFANRSDANWTWTLTLSHEALELIANPLINLYSHGPHPDPRVSDEERLVFHAYEVCDAVQSEYYEVDGFKVSNFLLPLYFTTGGHNEGRVVFQSDQELKPLRAFGLNPGGYIPFYDPKDRKYYHYFLSRNLGTNDLEGNYIQRRRMAHYNPDFFERYSTDRKQSIKARGNRKRSSISRRPPVNF